MSTTTLPPLYQPLDTSRRQIRLMMLTSGPLDEDIRCCMQMFDLTAMPKYTALSYAWGANENLQTITVNGRKCRVRPGLLEFLQVFKTWNDCRPIWVDQICIDQSNVLEKNHQVGIMEHIYRGAIETFCWLGPDPSNGRIFPAAGKLIAYARANSDDTYPFGPEDCEGAAVPSSEEISKFDQLAHLNYWERHWIIQEIYLSSNATIVLGPHTMPYSKLSALAFCPAIRVHIDDDSMLLDVLRLEEGPTYPNAFLFWAGAVAKRSVCSDARDKVYGIQSLLPTNLRIQVDYDISTREVWQNAMLLWIRVLQPEIKSSTMKNGCAWLADGMGLSRDEVCAAVEALLQICDDVHAHEHRWLTSLLRHLDY